MNVLDALIIVLAVAAAVGGFRLGFLARASSWLGMALGLLLAARVAPWVVDRVGRTNVTSLLVAAAGVLLLGALVGQLVGLVAGSRLRVAVPGRFGQRLDQTLGGVVGVVGVVMAVWLVLPVLSSVSEWPARQADASRIANFVDDELPDPPDTLRGLAGLIGQQRWNDLLTNLGRGVEVPAPPTTAGIDPVLETVERSVVQVHGEGCGNDVSGTGFVVEPGLVVTNAHVVAGVEAPAVAGQRAQVVAFDPEADLAALSVAGLGLPALPLGDPADLGDRVGGVLGYPGGTPAIVVSPYRIAQTQTVQVPNLYGGELNDRNVYFLAANLEEGDSGGPLVNAGGQVVGVAFAIAPDKPGLAFASSGAEIHRFLDGVHQALAADPDHREDTSRCLTTRDPVDPVDTALGRGTAG